MCNVLGGWTIHFRSFWVLMVNLLIQFYKRQLVNPTFLINILKKKNKQTNWALQQLSPREYGWDINLFPFFLCIKYHKVCMSKKKYYKVCSGPLWLAVVDIALILRYHYAAPNTSSFMRPGIIWQILMGSNLIIQKSCPV